MNYFCCQPEPDQTAQVVTNDIFTNAAEIFAVERAQIFTFTQIFKVNLQITTTCFLAGKHTVLVQSSATSLNPGAVWQGTSAVTYRINAGTMSTQLRVRTSATGTTRHIAEYASISIWALTATTEQQATYWLMNIPNA